MTPKAELRARILAKVASRWTSAAPSAAEITDTVMELFWTVEDEWDRVSITEFGTDGESWLDNRFLVARMPVQSQRSDRIAVREANP